MKIESILEKLIEGVNRIQKVSSKNVSLPILENVLLRAEDNTLILRSTNLHVGAEVSIPVKVLEKGEVAVRLDLFANILNSLKKEHKILLEIKDQVLSLKTEKSEMSINTYDSSDFPTIPHVDEGIRFTLPIKKFIDGVRSVAYASSLSDIKPEISSVYIYTSDNELVFVATDSFRLAEKRIVMSGIDEFPGVIIPIKNIQECIKVFQGLDGDVVFTLGENQIALRNEYIYFTSRIVDGNYPDYMQIIPQEEKSSLILLKNDITDALKLVNVFSDNFKISLKTKKAVSQVHFTSRNPDVGENSTFVDAVVEGEDIEMNLNYRYLTDVLQIIDTDNIHFSFTENNKPFLVKSVDDSSFLYLIMPMNR